MRRQVEQAGWIGIYVAVISGIVLIVFPSLKTKAYFGFCRAWYTHCPFAAARTLPLRFAPPEPYVPVWTKIEPGVTMLLDPHDAIGQNILLKGQWEPETWRALEPHIPIGGTFIDVGADIGWYSLKAAKAVGPEGRVIAVEPDRDTLIKLRDNIRANGASSIIVVEPVACSESETTLTFYAAPRENQGRSSLSQRNASETGPLSATYQVRARRLDDIVKEENVVRVDAMKVDVEGAEFLVLKGSTEILDRYKPVISMEMSIDHLKEMGTTVEEILALMLAHGYQPTQITEENVIFVSKEPPRRTYATKP